MSVSMMEFVLQSKEMRRTNAIDPYNVVRASVQLEKVASIPNERANKGNAQNERVVDLLWVFCGGVVNC